MPSEETKLIKIANSCFKKEQHTITLNVKQQKVHNYFWYLTELGTPFSKNKCSTL